MLRIDSPPTIEEEEIVTETIRGGIEVHRVLGPGFREPIYHHAFKLEPRLKILHQRQVVSYLRTTV